MDAAPATSATAFVQAADAHRRAAGPRQLLLFALFLLIAIALKATTLGDTNRHADETFYFLVGQRMHEGLLPYVDVWDRKPFGLFAIYYLIAMVSHSVLVYQLVACAMAAGTAFIVARIVAVWADVRAALFAGVIYLFANGPFEGGTGQTPDFYNVLIAGAALCLSLEMPRLLTGSVGHRTWVAMALCGLAITVKQTTLFESLYFGVAAVFCLWRGGMRPVALVRFAATAAAIGAAPTLAVAAGYALSGHWPEFWHAMVTSNLVKRTDSGAFAYLTATVVRAWPLLLMALGGLASAGRSNAGWFLGGWLFAAVVGFLAVPNFYVHYLLPVIVPLSVASGLLLARTRFRLVLVVAVALYAMLWDRPDRSERTRASIESMNRLSSAVRQHDAGGGLLVFDGPVYLYALTGKPFLSPLVFPHHLNHAIEADVSHLDTLAEVERVLANRPGVIVMSRFARNYPVNRETRAKVLGYVSANCRHREEIGLVESGRPVPTLVFGDCRQTPAH